jgi:DUF1365 family protein
MSEAGSAIYFGTVVHRRLRPRPHRLNYRVFSLLLDLDELPELGRRLRLFSHNAFNLLSFHDGDHGAGGGPLRPHVEAQLKKLGIEPDGGPIRLLCSPRMLGYVFNPLSVYFCHRRDGGLAAILYEVNNTFGERHTYAIAVAGAQPMVRQSCAKRFHVSPFLGMAATYDFRILPPGDRVAITVSERDADGDLLHASLTGARAELGDRQLLRALLAYPLLTLKVIVGIHWHAMRLFLKGTVVHPHPQPPEESVTLVAAARE